jgi:hypothetical protein
MNGVGLVAALVVALAAQQARAASDVVASAQPVARASIDIAIVVPRVMHLRLLAHPAAIDVSADDIARGTLRVSGASLDILANDRFGYVLRAQLSSAAFSAARILGLPGALMPGGEAAMLRMPSMVGRPRPAPIAIEYELQLSPDAVPGRYAWPVALTLQDP